MLAFHGIFTAYGFWLPNDPRGSWSKWVGAWELFLASGPAPTVVTTRSLAGRPHDRGRREQVKQRLKHRRVQFTGIQARAIGAGFAKATRTSGYVCWPAQSCPVTSTWSSRRIETDRRRCSGI